MTERPNIIETLAQDARVRMEARMLPTDRDLTKAEIAQVRARAAEYFEQHKLSGTEVGRKIARAPSSITEFLRDKFVGNEDKLARLIHEFIEIHSRGVESGFSKEFVSTSIAEGIIALCKMAAATRTVNLVYGPAGVGKSIVFRACAEALIPGSAHIEITEGARAPAQFARMWARRLKLSAKGCLGEVEDRIITALTGSDRLQMIDESQRLSNSAFEVVRDVHKQSGVGIVLGGTVDIEGKVNDFHEHYGQWESLVNIRYDILAKQQDRGEPLFTPGEIVKFAATMQLKLTPRAVDWLGDRIGSIPGYGGLRKAKSLLYTASLMAKHDGAATIDLKHLRAAFVQNEGKAHYELMERRLVEAQRRKVAVA
jgi:DNA transposition AAA+ family ATPase